MADDQRHLSSEPPGPRPPEEPRLDGRASEERRETAARLLRRTREMYGEDLGEIAEALRIRHAYLSAIEQGAFDELPGPTYAVGFVRSYAAFLGLDADEVVRRFKDDVAGLERTQELHFPEPVNEGKVPGGALVLIALVLLVGAYGGWYVLTSPGASLSEMVPPVPERLQALVGDGAETGATANAGAPEAGTAADGPEEPAAAANASDSTETAAASGEAGGTAAASDPADPDGAPDVVGEGASVSAGTTATETGAASDTPSEPEAQTGADAETDGASATTAGASEPAAPSQPAEAGGAAAANDNGAVNDTGAVAVGEEGVVPPEADDGDTTAAGTADATAVDTVEPANAATADSAAATGEAATDGGTTEEASGAPPVPGAADGEGEAGATQTAEAPSGRAFGAGAGDSAFVLRATADSWVQVLGPDDEVLVSRVLEPGDVYRVPRSDGLRLHTGNAGGLTVERDGQAVRTLGDAGEVRRNIALTPDNLLGGG